MGGEERGGGQGLCPFFICSHQEGPGMEASRKLLSSFQAEFSLTIIFAYLQCQVEEIEHYPVDEVTVLSAVAQNFH